MPPRDDKLAVGGIETAPPLARFLRLNLAFEEGLFPFSGTPCSDADEFAGHQQIRASPASLTSRGRASFVLS